MLADRKLCFGIGVTEEESDKPTSTEESTSSSGVRRVRDPSIREGKRPEQIVSSIHEPWVYGY